MIRSEQRLSPEAQSFQRLPSYVRAGIINRANSMGVDYIALFQAEQRQALGRILPPDLSSQRNVESCTVHAQNADHMPFSEGADEMSKRQKFTINGQQRYASFDADQMITKSSIISEKYAQLTSKSCSENCSGESA